MKRLKILHASLRHECVDQLLWDSCSHLEGLHGLWLAGNEGMEATIMG